MIYPAHPNPGVRAAIADSLDRAPENLIVTDPLDYQPFVQLLSRAHVIVTDSGGIQEEAPSLDKPVLVVRDVTERGEAVEAGCLRLVGTDPARLVAELEILFRDEAAYLRMARSPNPFGDGAASERIRDILERYFSR